MSFSSMLARSGKMDGARVKFEPHTGDPERDLAYERERRRIVDEDGVPTEVADYLDYFAQMIEKKDVPEIHNLYEQHFPDLTERFYRERMWPDEQTVESIVGSENRLFIILYKELYYRQVYARNQRGPSLSHRFESFMNYQDLFSEILSSKDPVSLSLPNVWLWDIIDEFVYQFQAFCLYKANPGKRSVDEVDELISIEEAQNAWNIYPVLNILYSLLSKSQINEQLAAIRARRNPDDVADEFGQSALYFKLGYFSLIGLLRTHVLLGDYHQALKTVENVEFDAKGLYNTVPSCLVTLHYFVGFSHMMMRNYGEATKMFVNCLMFIQRTKAIQTQQQKQKNFQYDVIGKTYDQLFHLLAICLAIQPQRIDESIASQLVERCGDRMSRMGNGDLDEFRLAFQMGCPKFLSPTTVVYEGSNLSKEPLLRQSQAFLEGVEAQMALPVLRGYLKLYTSLPTKKLASFMDVDDKNYDSFLGKLLTYKMVVNELGKDSLASSNDDDEPNTDIDFYVDKDMICIADTKVARRVGEHFIRHMQKLYEVQKLLKKLEPRP
nr:RNA polymerase I-associated factor PAF67 domain containing protein [Haemonchus contortus]